MSRSMWKLLLLCTLGTSCAFICNNSRFVQDFLLCNGINDCGDRSDEQMCLSCIWDAFHCNSSFQCIRPETVCDTHTDCFDESDEANCPCLEDEFECGDKDCISLADRCNGLKNCVDGSDEQGCYNCTAGAFHCVKSGECIPKISDPTKHPGCMDTVTPFEDTSESTNGKENVLIPLLVCLCLVIVMLVVIWYFRDTPYRHVRCRSWWDLLKIFNSCCCPCLKSQMEDMFTKSCRPVWKKCPEKPGDLNRCVSETPELNTLLDPTASATATISSPTSNLSPRTRAQSEKYDLKNDDMSNLLDFARDFVINCKAKFAETNIDGPFPTHRRAEFAAVFPKQLTNLATDIFLVFKDHISEWCSGCPENKTLLRDLAKFAGCNCAPKLAQCTCTNEILESFVRESADFKENIWYKLLNNKYSIQVFFGVPSPALIVGEGDGGGGTRAQIKIESNCGRHRNRNCKPLTTVRHVLRPAFEFENKHLLKLNSEEKLDNISLNMPHDFDCSKMRCKDSTELANFVCDTLNSAIDVNQPFFKNCH